MKFPKIIKTPRLEMRVIVANEKKAQVVFDALRGEVEKDYEFEPITYPNPLPKSVDEMYGRMKQFEEWASETGAIYYIFENDRFIGMRRIFINTDTETMQLGSVWFIKSARRYGYGAETMRALEQLAFVEMGLNRITRQNVAENSASSKMAEKCGFSLDGTLRDAIRGSDKKYHDMLIWSKLKSEYKG